MTSVKYMFDSEELTRFANQVKEVVLHQIVKEGETESIYSWGNQNAVVVLNKGTFGTWFDDFFLGRDENDKQMRIVIVKGKETNRAYDKTKEKVSTLAKD